MDRLEKNKQIAQTMKETYNNVSLRIVSALSLR